MDLGYKLEEENPWNHANIFSRLFFGWMAKLVGQGSRNNIEIKTLYKVLDKDKSEDLGNILEKNWNAEVFLAQKLRRSPSFLKALVKTFLPECILYGLLWFLAFGVFGTLQPMILKYLIALYTGSHDNTRIHEMYICSAILIGLLICTTMANNHHNFGMGQLAMRVRVAASSLIYRKITRLNQKSLGQTAAGQIINLLSNDVNRFDLGIIFIHALWLMPIQLLCLGYFIWNQVGISSLSGLITLTIISLPLQGYLATVLGILRSRISKKTDRRVKLMSEILAGIQVIKIYAWEKPFEKVVEYTRRQEVKHIAFASYIKGFYASCQVYNANLSLCLTIVTYKILGNSITADKVFSLAQVFNTLQVSMSMLFPWALSNGSESLVSIERIQDFLMMEEGQKNNAVTYPKAHGVIISEANATWTEIGSTLENISVKIPPGTLCAIVGPVGAGKSSLLQLLLGEFQPKSGKIEVGGEISYSSQEPWLFQSTIRNNILFGKSYVKHWYDKVVKVCALERDFEQFPQRDLTIVGERGVSLSGGQKARINLARSIYHQADVYLLDDPLSAVDTHVGKHLFEECIHKLLKGKIVILVTHQLQYLKRADLIIVLDQGKIQAQGTYEELSNMKLDFTKLVVDENESGEKEGNTEAIIKSPVAARKISAILPATTTLDTAQECEAGEQKSEKIPNGKPLKGYFLATKKLCFVVSTFIMIILAQTFCVSSDFWLSLWTGQEAMRNSADSYYVPHYQNDSSNINNSSGNASTEFLFGDLYEEIEVNGVETKILNANYGMIIYGVLIGFTIIFTITRSLMFYKVCMLSSINLHNKIFHALLQAPMRFFDKTSSGRILNRFSKDMGAIDEILPRVLLDVFTIFLVMLGIMFNISISNPYFIIAVIILALAFLKFRSLYISTAKSIKHIEGITKSPVFSHVNATLNGLKTIRALKAEDIIIEEFDEHQDVHSAAWFLTVSTKCTFGLWLDIACISFVVVITFGFVILYSLTTSVNGSLIGLAISQSLMLIGMMQFGMTQTAEAVNQLISVERVLQYTTLENEGPFDTPDDKTPKVQWPNKALIEFKQLTLKYATTDPPVLKGLDFTILPGQKVGIVGRTGAGKSSLIAALFRLAPFEGSILIDGIDTKTLGLSDLRKKISIIPQDPVLFSATLRYNLDPFTEYDDDRIWNALAQVSMKDCVNSLDLIVSEGGTNFSLGQRQLICLARAILRNNKILVLDEATANVDHKTDSFIQATIRERFASCTVLTIAHRLNTIMDSDKVLVMNFGKMVEFDHPYKLLQIPEGYFHKMVLETGPMMSAELKEMARLAYIKEKEI